MGTVAAGASILLITEGLLNSGSLPQNVETLVGRLDPANSQSGRASLITVKVYYSMMADYTSLGEEDFVLQSPATIHDLVKTVLVRHPSLAGMMGTMLTLLNGTAAKPTAPLNDGGVVQFIPLAAGG
jgi:molybdopterin converting factor small subunit